MSDTPPPVPPNQPPSIGSPTPPQNLGYAGPPMSGYGGDLHGAIYENAGRAKTAALLLVIYAIISLVAGINQAVPYFLDQARFLEPSQAFGQGQTPSVGFWIYLGVSAVLGCGGTIFAIVTIVFYMMWQYRATINANAIGNPTTFGPGLGVGAWFIPLANLIMVPMFLFSLWRASGRAAQGGGGLGSPKTLLLLFVGSVVLYIAIMAAGFAVGFQTAQGNAGQPGAAFGLVLGIGQILVGIVSTVMIFGLSRYVIEVQKMQPPATAA